MNFLEVATTVSLVFLSTALALILIRIKQGPTTSDRVVGLDLTAIILIGVLCATAVRFSVESLLDVAVALALVIFLGTVALAKFVGRNSS
ncbi:MAG: monovalent cation/H+ antiporter complex subunit F [Fimbriimonadaceae bacterium]|jgi:multicomponent Na+:H+ antiporter subunit F|nr:monovalent cation/H+ antiporter complex subunit F [Fimbriimonadaceae bacterium]